MLLFLLLFVYKCSFTQTKFQKDFVYFWQTIKDNYAYFDKQQINWDTVKIIYKPLADTCTTRDGLIRVFELTLNELYNGHSFLNTNLPASNRLVPSGADVKIIYRNGKFIIDEVREGFNSDLCGLKKGMQLTTFNNQPIAQGVKKYLPKYTANYNTGMYQYAANMLLAGTHNTKRKITVLVNGISKDFYPDTVSNKTEAHYKNVLESKKLEHNIGYIRINNSLGDNNLISEFDSALNKLFNTNGLIVDLRETPGGGTSTIARAIMGRFINKEMPYQKHLYIAEERQTGIKRTALELVSPRNHVYTKPLVVLVGYWTASMGEGLAIGFDAMKRATIIGTPMAGLLGEIFTFETPELNIPFSFPCVQLQTVSGLPREDFIPKILADDQQQCLRKAISLLMHKQ